MTLIAGYEAAGEIAKIKDRTLRGKYKRIHEGKLWGMGRDKFGYCKDREWGIAVVNEADAETVRRIFSESCEGKSLLAIARDLNKDGIPTALTSKGERKTQWQPGTVRVVLRDPAYKGEAWAFRYAKDVQQYKMPDNLFPAIVDAKIWNQAQEKLDT